MAYFSFSNIRIKGISAAVPQNKVYNCQQESDDYEEMRKFVKITGVEERRISTTLTSSDLCCCAAEVLLEKLNWNKAEVEAIIFVSEGRDFAIPSTSSLIQKRLGLPTGTYCSDVTLGCSGWVYGLNYVSSLLSKNGIKKALLLCGYSKEMRGVPTMKLFGHAGSATAVQYEEGFDGIKGVYGTDGSLYDSIIVPDGACRNLMTLDSWNKSETAGKAVNSLQIAMKGLNVFSFSVNVVPRSIKDLAEFYSFDFRECDYLILHQANKTINDSIISMLNYPREKCPYSISQFGNTSSASIPLTIVTNLKEKAGNDDLRFIASGFGVGLSWGTVMFNTRNLIIPDLIEVGEI